jgi:outer membrane lipoprotein-sorting protein
MPALLIRLFLFLTPCLMFADELQPLQIALEKQARHKTVSVKIRQTKRIPALNEEIVTLGHLWLKPGQAFRWQLGDPIVQSAVYDGTKVSLIDEKKKTAVALEPDDRRAKPLLLMLGIGEGASLEGIKKDFTIGGTTTVNEHYVISLVPKGQLKRAITSMVMQFNTRTSFPERIEWTQKDGTVVITEFFPPVLNKNLPDGIFDVRGDAYTWE